MVFALHVFLRLFGAVYGTGVGERQVHPFLPQRCGAEHPVWLPLLFHQWTGRGSHGLYVLCEPLSLSGFCHPLPKYSPEVLLCHPHPGKVAGFAIRLPYGLGHHWTTNHAPPPDRAHAAPLHPGLPGELCHLLLDLSLPVAFSGKASDLAADH